MAPSPISAPIVRIGCLSRLRRHSLYIAIDWRATRNRSAIWFPLSAGSQFRLVLKAADHETIPTSELYDAKDNAEDGIESVKKNSALDERTDSAPADDVRVKGRSTDGTTPGWEACDF
ncbi:DUF1508 domain-containing protein [Lysobacter antibioticus]|uniref:YegP family protein n=1 Tax=Lysobacter antibioticus TaxID=84531 RepID=UPI0007166E80|nr:DUF1508 domain-containing protein [Lysobacter antibioticus]